ncbi:glutamate racemase, partial [Streptomyces sp. NPDC005904]
RPQLPPLALYGSAGAVAAQALRRVGRSADAGSSPATPGLTVLLSGREERLPAAALAYAEGRTLAAVSPAL